MGGGQAECRAGSWDAALNPCREDLLLGVWQPDPSCPWPLTPLPSPPNPLPHLSDCHGAGAGEAGAGGAAELGGRHWQRHGRRPPHHNPHSLQAVAATPNRCHAVRALSSRPGAAAGRRSSSSLVRHTPAAAARSCAWRQQQPPAHPCVSISRRILSPSRNASLPPAFSSGCRASAAAALVCRRPPRTLHKCSSPSNSSHVFCPRLFTRIQARTSAYLHLPKHALLVASPSHTPWRSACLPVELRPATLRQPPILFPGPLVSLSCRGKRYPRSLVSLPLLCPLHAAAP